MSKRGKSRTRQAPLCLTNDIAPASPHWLFGTRSGRGFRLPTKEVNPVSPSQQPLCPYIDIAQCPRSEMFAPAVRAGSCTLGSAMLERETLYLFAATMRRLKEAESSGGEKKRRDARGLGDAKNASKPRQTGGVRSTLRQVPKAES